MLRSTFQLVPGIGPRRERALWRAGVLDWEDYLRSGGDDPLSVAISAAQNALAKGDIGTLAALVPAREHWRVFGAFPEAAVYLDIETSDDDAAYAGISAIGVLDERGPDLMLAGEGLRRFPERASGWSMLVTFNGSSFDVPILLQAFPDWQLPACHVDLRHALGRVGHGGGLKAIESGLSRLRLSRPPHLTGIDGANACWLFRRGREGDREALRRFAEYNLYDVVNLRTLMAYAYNRLLELEVADIPALRERATALPVPGRGDVLYDVSKILLSL